MVPPFAIGRMPETSDVSEVLPVVKPEPLPRKGPFRVVVTAIVPDVVTGEEPTEKPEGMVRPTLVTVPEPVEIVAGAHVAPFHCSS
mgnify:CR=1 FL=1